MKRFAFFLVALFLVILPAAAQTQTAVTGTITDPNGMPYANATVNIQLVPTGTPTVSGSLIGGAFNLQANAAGSFGASLWPNASISPASSKWQFTVCTSGIQPPLGTGPQCTTPTAITISGTAQVVSTTLSSVAPALINVIGASFAKISGGGTGSFSGAPILGSAPAMFVLDCTGCGSTFDTIGWLMQDSLSASNPKAEVVMKSNGQVESINLNTLGYINSEVGSAGTGEYTSYGFLQIDTVHTANISLLPGGGAAGDGLGDVLTKDLLSGPQKGNGTGATLTGTGACATVSAPITAGFVGATTCTGSTGATTLVITPPAIAVPGTTYICGGSDTGLLAGGGGPIAAGAQKGISGSTCTLQWTSVTTNDIITFWFYSL